MTEEVCARVSSLPAMERERRAKDGRGGELFTVSSRLPGVSLMRGVAEGLSDMGAQGECAETGSPRSVAKVGILERQRFEERGALVFEDSKKGGLFYLRGFFERYPFGLYLLIFGQAPRCHASGSKAANPVLQFPFRVKRVSQSCLATRCHGRGVSLTYLISEWSMYASGPLNTGFWVFRVKKTTTLLKNL